MAKKIKRTQLSLFDTAEEKREKYVAYLVRNIKKFEFYCELSEYGWIIDIVKRIRSEEGITTNSEVFVFLLKMYEESKGARNPVEKKAIVRKPDRKNTAGK